MWTDFTEKSQRALTSIVAKSAEEGRLHITIPRIKGLVTRLQAEDTPDEVRLKSHFKIKVDVRNERAGTNYSPLSFLYDGPLAKLIPVTI